MDKIQAETKAAGWSKMVRHPGLSYTAQELPATRWEKKRWGVIQRLDDHAVGIAAT